MYRFCLLFALSCVTPLAVSAQNPLPGGESFALFDIVQSWVIYSEEGSGRCLMERVDEAGTLSQVGRTEDGQSFYFGLFRHAAPEVPSQGRNELVVDDLRFDVDVSSVPSRQTKGNLSGGYVVLDDAGMADAVFNGRAMALVAADGNAVIVDLNGTDAAIASVQSCEQSF